MNTLTVRAERWTSADSADILITIDIRRESGYQGPIGTDSFLTGMPLTARTNPEGIATFRLPASPTRTQYRIWVGGSPGFDFTMPDTDYTLPETEPA